MVAPGYTGDGGPATQAFLDTPLAVVAAALVGGDGLGGAFWVESGNHVLRRLFDNGTLTTAAGTGFAAWTGDGGPASLAQFNTPTGLSIDGGAGNLLIAVRSRRCSVGSMTAPTSLPLL